MGCHGFTPGATTDLPSGEKLPIYIDTSHYQSSVHASKDITCTGCHSDITGYPHPKLDAQNLREVAINMSAACEKCHSDKYKQATDSVHHKALTSGNENAAVCSDCHLPHEQPQILNADTKQILPEMRVQIPQTCSKCHSAIYNEYKDSVHGSALTGEGNPDVPTCIDCHGVHNIADPTTPNFRLQSPQMCANCHTDEQKMAKYGLSTQVLSTYIADFHGTTVTLFQKQEPDQQTNKPVCFDCHGVHNISKVDDPQKGLAMKENVLASCRKCHPDATTNFPTSWLSHYIPSPSKSPLVYYVNEFYKFFVPTVLGGMAIFVVSDGTRRLIDRRKGAKRK
jgi:nitrate/TMAO reductase-like tetraheme cytochrome c subunit